MDFLRPASWEEALAAKAEHPAAVPLAGGTDVMVEINFDHRRPEYLLDLNRIGELYEWELGPETVRLGASVPYSMIMERLRAELPGLALHGVGLAEESGTPGRRPCLACFEAPLVGVGQQCTAPALEVAEGVVCRSGVGAAVEQAHDGPLISFSGWARGGRRPAKEAGRPGGSEGR